MGWPMLKERISSNDLPLILAGPMLRHTDLNSVTVWVATRSNRTVTLNVYQGTGPSRELVLSGERQTVELGKYLNVVAVTAVPIQSLPPNITALAPSKIYYYDLDFGEGQKLGSERVVDIEAITYGDDDLPSFAIPPNDLRKLRLIHGSCRKPHGPGRDMLPTVGMFIDDARKTATSPQEYAEKRPHQLFLTGDQIYADDVADDLLEVLTDVGNTLLGWNETLPGIDKKPQDLKPGERAKVSDHDAGLTSAIPDPHHAKSHLFALGEYYAMYLLAWSDVLWPRELPSKRRPTIGLL